MIQHIVLIKWKPDVTDEQIAAAFAQAQRLVDGIPSVSQVTLGRNRGHSDHGFTHALIVQLSRDEDLEEYLAHPVRSQYIAEFLEPLEDQRIEVDVPVDTAIHRSPSRNWHWGASVGMALPLDE
jgi:hypothetical protein